MSLSKFASVFLLVLLVLVAFAPVFADGEKPVSDYNRKPCENDRNRDEEKNSADCYGTAATPEPLPILLFSAGLAGVGFAARKRRSKES